MERVLPKINKVINCLTKRMSMKTEYLQYGESDFDFDDHSKERMKVLNENLRNKIRRAQEEAVRQKTDLNKR